MPNPAPAVRASATARSGSRGSAPGRLLLLLFARRADDDHSDQSRGDTKPRQAAWTLSECDADHDRQAGRDHGCDGCHSGHQALGQRTEEDKQTDAAGEPTETSPRQAGPVRRRHQQQQYGQH